MTNERLPLFTQSAGVFAVALLVLAPLSLLGSFMLLLARENPGSFDWYITDDGGLLRGYGWVFGQALVAVDGRPRPRHRGGARRDLPPWAAPPPASGHARVRGRRRCWSRSCRAPTLVEGRTWAAVLALLAAAGRGRRRGCARRCFRRASERCAPGEDAASVRPRIARPVLLGRACEPRTRRRPRRPRRDDVRERTARPLLERGAARASRRCRLLVAEAHRQDARRASHQPLRRRCSLGSAVLLALGQALAGWNDQPSRSRRHRDDAATASLLGHDRRRRDRAGLVLFGLAKLRWPPRPPGRQRPVARPTRSSGTRPRRRRRTTSTRCRRSTSARPLDDLRTQAEGAQCALT